MAVGWSNSWSFGWVCAGKAHQFLPSGVISLPKTFISVRPVLQFVVKSMSSLSRSDVKKRKGSSKSDDLSFGIFGSRLVNRFLHDFRKLESLPDLFSPFARGRGPACRSMWPMPWSLGDGPKSCRRRDGRVVKRYVGLRWLKSNDMRMVSFTFFGFGVQR